MKLLDWLMLWGVCLLVTALIFQVWLNMRHVEMVRVMRNNCVQGVE
jgi:hypothetical protein